MEVSSPQFLFTDADFESDEFNPAAFVAKYRRATSLDSLRSQLRMYCQSLKDQLYNIINRDYKDFITIATKLEGVDHRVEYLRKPLIELRMDLTQLNDTIVSNLHAISGKIQQRREVSNRRRLLESSLACMTKLSNVEDVLNVNSDSPSSKNNSKGVAAVDGTTARRPLSRRALIQHAVRSQPDADPERLELFQCSELERAAMSLSEAHCHLREEKLAQQHDQGSRSSVRNNASHTPATAAMRRTLEHRSQNIQVALLARLQLCCRVLLSSTSAAGAESGSAAMSACRRRSLGHLLRGLVALGSGGVAEELVAELFTSPALLSLLTQGRVDGSQGRGSYSGLKVCLGEVVRTVGERVSCTLRLVEELFADQCAAPPVDLVVNGIWVPVFKNLKQQYAGMFSSGMASVFHECYQATHQFVQDLSGICGNKWTAAITNRMTAHKSFTEFKSLWKMDLHYQLRAQEIISRLDKSLALTSQHGLASQVFDEVYCPVVPSSSSASSKGDAKASIDHNRNSECKLSISTEEILQAEAAAAPVTWKLSLTRVFVIEILTCLHHKVYLKDLGGKMVSLVIKILNCFNVHLLALLDHRGPTGGGGIDPTSLTSPSTSSSGVSSASKSTPGGNTSSAAVTLSLRELTWGLTDLRHLAAWIDHSLGPLLEKTMFPRATPAEETRADGDREPERHKALIKACFDKQVSSVLRLSPLIWKKMADILVVDCRSGLKAVKSIAGKFRMTNKPPPDAASSYVASVLKPLKSFLEKQQGGDHKERGDEDVPAATSQWKLDIVESVTVIYHQQIEALLATAQQMDTTLQRRSKLGKKANSGQTEPSKNMSDSEKIALQILLDARAFGADIQAVCAVSDPNEVASYQRLIATVEEAQTPIDK